MHKEQLLHLTAPTMQNNAHCCSHNTVSYHTSCIPWTTTSRLAFCTQGPVPFCPCTYQQQQTQKHTQVPKNNNLYPCTCCLVNEPLNSAGAAARSQAACINSCATHHFASNGHCPFVCTTPPTENSSHKHHKQSHSSGKNNCMPCLVM